MATTPFDMTAPAANGLRRGYTTGTCATAAVKAALKCLLYGERSPEVQVTLPNLQNFVTIPIARIVDLPTGILAEVVKDAGDDPDQTHRATLCAKVSRNDENEIRFRRGPGVGVVTARGLPVAIGEPAINPVPRAMMHQAVAEVLAEQGIEEKGFDLEIGCQNGEAIAQRTFNPRLGILEGISILGTTGIVEPKSMAAFQAAIEIYIDVALADRPHAIALTPGNLGQKFALSSLGLPLKQIVQMSNFVGASLAHLQQALGANHRLPLLWIAGHPGKLAKILDEVWDTHSGAAGPGVEAVRRFAAEVNLPITDPHSWSEGRTVEALIETLGQTDQAADFWRAMEERIARQVQARVSRVDQVRVRLFRMDGAPLATS